MIERRKRILTTKLARRLLRDAIHKVRQELPFTIQAFVLLPDHLHAVWVLPRAENNYSTRWKNLKAEFTHRWLKEGGEASPVSASKQKKGERGVWQRRMHEHRVRDERDLKRCVDYIHVNPLKHGYVNRVSDWPWSSFHRYVEQGEYANDWGSAEHWQGDEFRYFE